MESDLAHAVIVADLIRGSLNDDIVLVDGGIVDGAVIDGEDVVVSGHGDQGEVGIVLPDAAVIYASK